jgi:hypothetical protein
MDDRRLSGEAHRGVARAFEFSRLGKLMLADAYERLMPISRARLDHVPPRASSRGNSPQFSNRKAGA